MQEIALQRPFFLPIYGKGRHAELPAQKFFKGSAARSGVASGGGGARSSCRFRRRLRRDFSLGPFSLWDVFFSGSLRRRFLFLFFLAELPALQNPKPLQEPQLGLKKPQPEHWPHWPHLLRAYPLQMAGFPVSLFPVSFFGNFPLGTPL